MKHKSRTRKIPERTEEDKVLQVGITVRLGGVDYEIKPLVIRDSRAWRGKVVKLLAEVPKYAKVTTDEPEEFGKALQAIIVGMSEQVADLFFGYAKDLDREKIETTATDAELGEAFTEVVKLAFPLVASLTKTLEMLSP